MRKKISELPLAGAITGSELIEIVQNGTNRKASILGIATGDIDIEDQLNELEGLIDGKISKSGTTTLTGPVIILPDGNEMTFGEFDGDELNLTIFGSLNIDGEGEFNVETEAAAQIEAAAGADFSRITMNSDGEASIETSTLLQISGPVQFNSIPTAPTADPGDDSAKVATTEFVQAIAANLTAAQVQALFTALIANMTQTQIDDLRALLA